MGNSFALFMTLACVFPNAGEMGETKSIPQASFYTVL